MRRFASLRFSVLILSMLCLPAWAQGGVTVVGDADLPLSGLTASGTWELRIYTIDRGRLDEFVAAWREGLAVDPLDFIAHGETWPITPATAER